MKFLAITALIVLSFTVPPVGIFFLVVILLGIIGED